MIVKNNLIFNEAEVVGLNRNEDMANTNSLWNEMKKTAKYRLEEIQKGKIEVADGMVINDDLLYESEEDLLDLPGKRSKGELTEKGKMGYNNYKNLLEVK